MRRKKDKSNGITALYERLSRDDDNAGESNSIVHQKQMLEDYAMKHGFTNLVHFTDDGWSGATFNRPDLNRMIEDAMEDTQPSGIMVKDMSRFGRNNAMFSLYLIDSDSVRNRIIEQHIFHIAVFQLFGNQLTVQACFQFLFQV